MSRWRKHQSPDEIIRKLRDAAAMVGTGNTIGQVCQRLKVSGQPFIAGGTSAAGWRPMRQAG